MEHAHVTEVKNPVCASNNQNYYSQIACHLDRLDNCFWFDLAMYIASSQGPGSEHNEDNEDNNEAHEPGEEARHLSHYHSPTCKVMDYFQPAQSLIIAPPRHSICLAIMIAPLLVQQLTATGPLGG